MSTVDLFDDQLTQSSRDGFIEYRYNLIYQVIMDSPNASAFDVLALPGLPAINSQFASPGGFVYVISRVPRRTDKTATNRKWMVTIGLTNNTEAYLRDSTGQPVAAPSDSVKEVVIEYEANSEALETGQLVSITANAPENHPGAVNLGIPPWFGIDRTADFGVTNSATDLVQLTKIVYTKRITVWRYELGWNSSYGNYLGAINSDSVQIVEVDSVATRFDETYPPGTLQIKDIIKQNVWRDQILYYRVGFVMDFKLFGFLRTVPDEGPNLYYSADNVNPETGVSYTANELAVLDFKTGQQGFGTLPITRVVYKDQLSGGSLPTSFVPSDYDTVTTGTVNLNGSGNQMPLSAGTGVTKVFLNWEGGDPVIPFAPLNL